MDQNQDKVHQDKAQKEKNLEAKMIIVLRLLSKEPNAKEKVYKFDKSRIVIGSVESADVKLTGEGISPIHAVLEIVDGKVGSIFDLASLSGVFVNEKKIVTQALADKDKITIGKFHLKYSLETFKGLKGGRDHEVTRETGGQLLFLDPKEDLAPLLLQDERGIEEIFDFRPTSKRALEVVMSWCNSILDVEHFINERKVTIGNTRSSHFGIPPLLSSSQYPIVTQSRGAGFVLNLDTQMQGVMQQNGTLRTLDEIRSKAMRGPNGYEVSIGNNDFAKISIGDIDFYLSYTAAPPRLKRRKMLEKDPFFTKVFSTSMALTLALFLILLKVKLPQTVDAEQVPERIATILYQPEKFMQPPPVPKPQPKPEPKPPEPKLVVKEEPKPVPKPPTPPKKVTVKLEAKPVDLKKPIPKVMAVTPPTKPQPVQAKPQAQPPAAKPAQQPKPAPRAEAKEGEGARAKGKEGSRGEPDKAKSKMKVTELSRPSPNSGSKGANTASEINEDGNVDLLKGAGGRIQNILGNSAAHLGDGGEKLKGFGNFSTGGSGGLALSGSGQGGGGNADTTLGGLGKKGNGMGRIGTGLGAAGNGSGIVGAHSRVEIRSDGPEEAVVMGSIDSDAIERALAAHKDEFRLCYEREINAENPNISGRIGVSFVIGASGRVSQAGIESSALKNHNAESCVLKVIRRIQFPMPQGGGVVEVKKVFNFASVK